MALPVSQSSRDHCPHRRSYIDDPNRCPSLLSEDVDEHVEKFMTLRSRREKPQIQFGACEQDMKLPGSSSRKRPLLDNETEDGAFETVLECAQQSWGRYINGRDVLLWNDDDSTPRPPKLTRTRHVSDEQEQACDIDSVAGSPLRNMDEFEMARNPWNQPQDVQSPSLAKLINKQAQEKYGMQWFESIEVEQRSIMDEIRRNQLLHGREHARDSSCRLAKADLSVSMASIKSPSKSRMPLAVGVPTYEDDRVDEIYPGQNVRILDKSHAFAALSRGNATVFECVNCNVKLVASKNAKILFCSECGTLAPADISGAFRSESF